MRSNNRKKAYMMSAVAILTAAITMLSHIYVHVEEVQAARGTLNGIKKIAESGSYSILEIVPESSVKINASGLSANVPAGALGYLIGGQEPFEKTTDYKARRDMINYLKTSKSLESITGDGNVLTDAGKYTEYLQDMLEDTTSANLISDIGDEDIVSLDGIAMTRGISGNYIKTYYEVSENGSRITDKALEYLKDGVSDNFVSANAGDFQPAFSYGGTGQRYSVTFEAIGSDQAISKKYGYKIENPKLIGEYGKGWDSLNGAEEGAAVYIKDGDIYKYAGTLSKNSTTTTISVSSVASVESVVSVDSVAEETTEYTEHSMSENLSSLEASPNGIESGSLILEPESEATGGAAVDNSTTGADTGAPEGNAPAAGDVPAEGNAPAEGDTPAGGNVPAAEGQGEGSTESPSGAADTQVPESQVSVTDNGIIPAESPTANEPEEDEQEETEYSLITMNTVEIQSSSLELQEGDELYTLEFRYIENDENAETLYHVAKWSLSSNGAYTLDESRGLVPDISGKGTVKEKDASKEYIVYQFDEGYGVYSPSQSEGAETIYERGADVYWGGGWKNNEWLKSYVFDRTEQAEFDGLNITVKTISASAVTESDISEAEFIYIAASGTGFIKDAPALEYGTGKDLSVAAAKEILRWASLETKPILAEAAIKDGADSVIKTLVSSLYAKDYAKAYDKYDGSGTVSVDMMEDSDGTFVNKRVYIFKNLFGSGNSAVNKNFDSDIGDNEGFTEVTKYIDYEKDNYGTQAESRISEATAIRHIIAYEKMVVKGVYRVLEIEPQDMSGELEGDSKTYTRMASSNVLSYDLEVKTDDDGVSTLYYMDHSVSYDLASSTVSDPDPDEEKKPLFATRGDILLTQMSVQEFIGRVDDLNSEYDLIYIGADTSGMNTGFYDQDSVTKKYRKYGPVYNDSDMNGMIYTNIGDLHKIDNHLYPGLPPQPARSGGNQFRFSGTDILKADIERLEDFADANLPIIFSDKLLNASKNGPAGKTQGTLDKNSNMYKAIDSLYDKSSWKKYMFAVSQVIEDNTTLTEYMEMARPQVELAESSEEGAVIDAKQRDDGTYYAEIKFKIVDSFASSSTEYTAEFYIDRNADGKYSAMERDTSAINWHDVDTEDGRAVKLKKNENYTVTRSFTDNQNGCVPWRIVVYQDGDSTDKKRRGNVTGYTRIERAEKPEIKVLQLLTSPSSGYSSAVVETVDLEKVKRNNNTKLGRYLNDVNNNMSFTLNIHSVKCETFIEKDVPSHKVEDYLRYLEEYDLVICGFADCWSFGRKGYEEYNSLAAEALMEYIREGRSVLFSHDCTSYHSTNSDWGYEINKYVRDAVGMNRYGYQPNKFGTNTPIELMYKDEQYDKIYKPSASETGEEYSTDYRQGEVYHSLMRYTSDTYGYNRLNTLTSSADINPNGNGNDATYNVTKVNNGQITKYPYVLDDEIEVTNTHAQYFQLNFNADQDEDGMGDLVVWYCLGDALKNHKKVTTSNHNNLVKQRVYRNSKNDVRNNYFIYSVGNVTYTGQGHRDFSDISDEECKLFINTLIAAYSSSVHAPDITIHSSQDISSSVKTTEILPFDTGLLEESFNTAGGGDENTYVDIKTYPDYGDGTASDDGSLITVYFLPAELNVNVEDSKTEVSFFVEDDTNSNVVYSLKSENKDGGDPVYESRYPGFEPLKVVSVRKYASDLDTEGTEIKPSHMENWHNEPYTTNVGSIETYQLDSLEGNTMYSVTFDLSEIVKRQKSRTTESGTLLAINNFPNISVALHTRAIKFTQPKHQYNSASLKFARAQLFMLE
ncbi:MAG: DUF5057 domain-containing protein [Lachnospiraceae bacterium]|nr:DUF5057 domain-containing protein [Lachnospiraceae bacterium]